MLAQASELYFARLGCLHSEYGAPLLWASFVGVLLECGKPAAFITEEMSGTADSTSTGSSLFSDSASTLNLLFAAPHPGHAAV